MIDDKEWSQSAKGQARAWGAGEVSQSLSRDQSEGWAQTSDRGRIESCRAGAGSMSVEHGNGTAFSAVAPWERSAPVAHRS